VITRFPEPPAAAARTAGPRNRIDYRRVTRTTTLTERSSVPVDRPKLRTRTGRSGALAKTSAEPILAIKNGPTAGGRGRSRARSGAIFWGSVSGDLRAIGRRPRHWGHDVSVEAAPESHYAKTADGVRIAYQSVGSGPRDIIWLSGGQYPLDAIWDYPDLARFFGRIATFSRLMLLDPHGWGASEGAPATFETFVDDVTTVLDACGSTRATVVGFSEGGPVAILYGATYPERTAGLVLLNTFAKWLRADDYPCGLPNSGADALLAAVDARWGSGMNALGSPTLAGDEAFRRWTARCERIGAPPNIAQREIREWMSRDLRPILDTVLVPTLILHRTGNPFIRIANGRYLADHIAGAKYVELPGEDHLYCVGDQDALLDEIEEFVTGAPPVREPDRALSTVLFTDIVASTEHAVRLGDRAWSQVLDRHDTIVRRELDRHRGRKVNPTGDGMLATFDGPARAIRCAQAISSALAATGVAIRAGLHTGEVELRGEDIGGIAVHIGQRISALAGPGEVLVSRTVTDLVAGSGICFADRGDHDLKGVPGTWRVFAVSS